MPKFLAALLTVVSTLWLLLHAATAETITYPTAANVINITLPPYNAKGDGKSDDTQAIQKALDDHGSKHRTIYFPTGTYLITDTLRWGKGQKHNIFEGENRNSTIIRLKDGTPSFNDIKKAKALIWTGVKPAQRFRNSICNLTIDSGKNNPGAIGIQFNTSNQGGIFDVTVKSGDGTGVIGIDLGYTTEIGPLLVDEVEVIGFATGIRCASQVNSMTLDRVTLRNQLVVGLTNSMQVVNIRRMETYGSVPAITADGNPMTVTTVLDSSFTYTAKKPSLTSAISTRSVLFARNVKTSGFKAALDYGVSEGDIVAGSSITEFCTKAPKSLFSQPESFPAYSWKDAPLISRDPIESWANVKNFGAKGDAHWPPSDKYTDDTEAIQKAIDSGASTVFFPQGAGYQINGTLRIRGKIKRFLGNEAVMLGKGTIILETCESDAVMMERMVIQGAINIETRSSKPVIVNRSYINQFHSKGTGELFFNDVSNHWQHPYDRPTSFLLLDQAGQKVWCRQINPETNANPKIINHGAELVILGLKTEGCNIVVKQTAGSTTILGAHLYVLKPQSTPAFLLTGGSLAIVGCRQWDWKNADERYYSDYVTVEKNGASRTLTRADCLHKMVLPFFVETP